MPAALLLATPRLAGADAALLCGRMDRIVIIECGGSGKTVVARRLANLLDAPLTLRGATSALSHEQR